MSFSLLVRLYFIEENIDSALEEKGIKMSFLIQPPIPERLNRCQLFGPGSRQSFLKKWLLSG